MIKRLAIIGLLLTACGGNFSDRVEVIHYPRAEFPYPLYEGYTTWGDQGCVIKLMYPEEYDSDDYYTWVLGHEMCHCIEGDFHEGMAYVPIIISGPNSFDW